VKSADTNCLASLATLEKCLRPDQTAATELSIESGQDPSQDHLCKARVPVTFCKAGDFVSVKIER